MHRLFALPPLHFDCPLPSAPLPFPFSLAHVLLPARAAAAAAAAAASPQVPESLRQRRVEVVAKLKSLESAVKPITDFLSNEENVKLLKQDKTQNMAVLQKEFNIGERRRAGGSRQGRVAVGVKGTRQDASGEVSCGGAGPLAAAHCRAK